MRSGLTHDVGLSVRDEGHTVRYGHTEPRRMLSGADTISAVKTRKARVTSARSMRTRQEQLELLSDS